MRETDLEPADGDAVDHLEHEQLGRHLHGQGVADVGLAAAGHLQQRVHVVLGQVAETRRQASVLCTPGRGKNIT